MSKKFRARAQECVDAINHLMVNRFPEFSIGVGEHNLAITLIAGHYAAELKMGEVDGEPFHYGFDIDRIVKLKS